MEDITRYRELAEAATARLEQARAEDRSPFILWVLHMQAEEALCNYRAAIEFKNMADFFASEQTEVYVEVTEDGHTVLHVK